MIHEPPPRIGQPPPPPTPQPKWAFQSCGEIMSEENRRALFYVKNGSKSAKIAQNRPKNRYIFALARENTLFLGIFARKVPKMAYFSLSPCFENHPPEWVNPPPTPPSRNRPPKTPPDRRKPPPRGGSIMWTKSTTGIPPESKSEVKTN